MEFLIGIICGFLLSLFFSLGPAFFSLIQNSIHHGFKKATSFVFGVGLSDIIIVLLMLTVLSNVDLNALLHNIYVASISGIIIGIFGVHTFRSKVKKVHKKESQLKFKAEGATHRWQLLLYGFSLNFLNPLIWIYWVSIITFLSAEMNLSVSERYIFFTGMLVGSTGCDLLKCRLSAMLQSWFTARILNRFNKLMGSILIAFSLYLIISMILYQTSPKIREREEEHGSKSTRIIQTIHNRIHRDTAKVCDTIQLQDSVPTDSLAPTDGDEADTLTH